LKPLGQLVRRLLVRSGLLKASLSEEDLKEVIDAGGRSGALDETEHQLITSIFEFSDTTAKEIMVPRPDIVALEVGMARDELLSQVIEEGYSRMPLYSGSIDNIIGIIYSKDLLSLMEHEDLIILQDIVRPAYFVPESKRISELLREFQSKKIHVAIVVDEFGGTEGIVTMEDIIEEIVGEIHDEYDEVKKSIEQAGDGIAIVDGNMSIHDFNEQFGGSIPDTGDYETLAGFLQKLIGRFPEVNEEIPYEGFTFAILSKSARRIRQIKVVPPPRLAKDAEEE